MVRKRIIKKIGNSWFIKLEPIDLKDFGITVGDEVDIDDLNLMEVQNEN